MVFVWFQDGGERELCRRGQHKRGALPEHLERVANQVRAAALRLRDALSAGGDRDRQHADRGGVVQAAHAHAHQRRADGHGAVRHVHPALPVALALLHVHLWQPLQAAVAAHSLLRLVKIYTLKRILVFGQQIMLSRNFSK